MIDIGYVDDCCVVDSYNGDGNCSYCCLALVMQVIIAPNIKHNEP